jgi:hypothetical protein
MLHARRRERRQLRRNAVSLDQYDDAVLAWLTMTLKQAAVDSQNQAMLDAITSDILDLVRLAQAKAKGTQPGPQPVT